MNFTELNRLLTVACAGISAAECHGFICGYMCINNHMKEEVLRFYLFTDSSDDNLARECLCSIESLAADVNAQISSLDFSLELMLPDDSNALQERGASFVQWCEGFLGGLAAAGINEFGVLSRETREIIDDLYRICQLAPDDMGNSDEEEAALTELIEYIRMGAILIHDEFHRSTDSVCKTDILH